jgi:hypothetical protein
VMHVFLKGLHHPLEDLYMVISNSLCGLLARMIEKAACQLPWIPVFRWNIINFTRPLEPQPSTYTDGPIR